MLSTPLLGGLRDGTTLAVYSFARVGAVISFPCVSRTITSRVDAAGFAYTKTGQAPRGTGSSKG